MVKSLKKRLGILLGVVCAVLLVVACAPAAPTTEAPAEKEIKLGIQLITTGPFASVMERTTSGPLLYLQYLNDELGGIEYKDPITGETDNVKLDLVWEDNGYNAARAIAIYKRQKAAGVQVMMVNGSVGAEAVARMQVRDRMPNCAVYSSMTEVLYSRYLLTDRDSPVDQIGVFIDWVMDNWSEPRPPRVGVIAIDVASYRPFGNPEQLPAYASMKGAELVGIEWHPATSTDFTLEVTRLIEKEVDWVYFSSTTAVAAMILKDANRLGFLDKAKWCNIVGSSSEEIIEMAGPISEGFYMQIMTALPTQKDIAGVQLAEHIWKEYRNEPLNLTRMQCIPGAIFLSEALKTSLEEVGYENLTSEDIRDGLFSVKEVDCQGIIPPITIDPEWPIFNPYVGMAQVKGGKIEPISEFYKYPGIMRGLLGH